MIILNKVFSVALKTPCSFFKQHQSPYNAYFCLHEFNS